MAAKKRPRTERREADRAAEKLARDRERLAALEPGGCPERSIEVSSASLVEPQAASTPCARCGERVRVDEHTAETIDGMRVRVAKVRCVACGTRRSLYFRIGTTLLN